MLWSHDINIYSSFFYTNKVYVIKQIKFSAILHIKMKKVSSLMTLYVVF